MDMKAFINLLRNKWNFIILVGFTVTLLSAIQIKDVNPSESFSTNLIKLIDTKFNVANMDSILELQKHMVLVHEVNINTSPDKIWDFLIKINKNYSVWHPKDHILFNWTSGNPFETGSTFYAEQYMMDEKIKYNGKITESIEGEKITMTFSFPLSLITEKIEMIIVNKGTYSTFKHITYMKFKFLSRTIFKNQNLKMLNDMDAHVKTEGNNMKNILENFS
jgi:hypothetical protein